MKNILVTGSNGQLGTEIQQLAPALTEFKFLFTDVAELDITNAEAVEQFFVQNAIDICINCAAYTAVDKAESEKELAYKINAEAVKNLAANTAKSSGLFFHISTDFIFDGNTTRPLLEDDVPNPISVYGATKLAGEKEVFANNPKSILLRTSWVYSSFGNNFVKTIVRLCKEKPELKIIYDQIGTPTYARDLAKVVLEIMQHPDLEQYYGVYNYSNEGVASWYDFAIAIRDLAELNTPILPIETTQYPTPAARPKYSVLNKQKIKETFGITIPYWRESLLDCIKQLS